MVFGRKIGIAVLGTAAIVKVIVFIDSILSRFRSRDSRILSVVSGALKPNERNILCVFVHFDRDNVVDDYVLHHLNALGEAGVETIFCTTAEGLSDTEIEKVSPYCRTMIVRRNVGYDFVSYRAGLEEAGDLSRYDTVVLANDSVYGPLRDLKTVFSAMADTKADFWGVTDSTELAYHLQSYFLVFRKSVATSNAFKKFWRTFPNYAQKHSVIAKGEVGLSKTLLANGYKPGVFCESKRIVAENSEMFNALEPRYILRMFMPSQLPNPTHQHWRLLIERYGCPFIKVNLLRDNLESIPDVSDWEAVVRKHSDYDSRLIRKHLRRMARFSSYIEVDSDQAGERRV